MTAMRRNTAQGKQMKIERTAKVTGFDASVADAVEWLMAELPNHGQGTYQIDDNRMSLSEDNPSDLAILNRIARKEQLIAEAEELLNACDKDSAEWKQYKREVIEHKAGLLQIKKDAFGVDRSTKTKDYFTVGSFLAAVSAACAIVNQKAEWLNGDKVAIVGGSCNEDEQTFSVKRYVPKQMNGRHTKKVTLDQKMAAWDKANGYSEPATTNEDSE